MAGAFRQEDVIWPSKDPKVGETPETLSLRFNGSDATLVHLRDLWHVCASAIASAGVYCKTLLSKAFR